MRDSQNIQISEMIAHFLDRGKGKPILSPQVIDLQKLTRLAEDFVSHIEKSLGDPSARAAKFVKADPKAASGLCPSLISGKVELVSGSRQLAGLLYTAMGKHPAIKPGDLFVCKYSATVDSKVGNYLGLFKIDPSDAFQQIIVDDGAGNEVLDFRLIENLLPTKREALQKCAFIRPRKAGADYDMLLLDRQARGEDEKSVAKFFIEDFLGAKWYADELVMTQGFYRSMLGALNQVKTRVSKRQYQNSRSAVDVALGADWVDVGQVISGLSLPRKEKEDVAQSVSQQLPDNQFKVHRPTANNLTRTAHFVGDYNLHVKVDANDAHRVIKTAVPVKEAGRPPFWRVTIETERWEEVS